MQYIYLFFPFNRYVQGRPRLLDNELPRIQFLEDRSGSEQRLLSSRITQQDLSNNMQYQIETELKSLPDLCQLLESVYTAKDFLMEAGGQHDLSLAKFLVRGDLQSNSIIIQSQFLRPTCTFTMETYPALPMEAPSDTYSWAM